MYKLWKYYNQNRLKVWGIILAITIGFIVIRILNFNYKNEKKEKNNETNTIKYFQESKSMVDGGKVSDSYSEELGDCITQFFEYCIEHNPVLAYTMLANDTKQEIYPTEELFEKNYYEKRFNGNKQFSFQSWSSSNNIYIYQVKIFDNMLATGKTSDNYIEEYIAVTTEGGESKINLNGYLGKTIIGKKVEDDNIAINVAKVDKYLDYEIYTVNIQNKTNKNILLDAKRKNKTCFVEDKNNNKFEAVLYENTDDDLDFQANETKTIKIKFNITNRVGLEIKSINFTDIVDKVEYKNNPKIEGMSFKAEI